MDGFCRLFTCLLMLTGAIVFAAEQELIGEGNDGNRSDPVHLFELYDTAGQQIHASDENPKPFSTKQTCGKCHDYQKISKGWHFNSHNPDIEKGRPSQPWVLTDAVTRTQIPISGRKWPGSFAPQDLGITPWDFQKQFFSHWPGGSYGEMPVEEPDQMIRKDISGDYEINCLACHHNRPEEDQSMAALQAARQNFRWIPTASSGKAVVNGVASQLSDFFDPEFDEGIKVAYNPGIFDKDDKVFFDVSGAPVNDRCYFCHSNNDLRVSEEKFWTQDQDVHLKSGLNCTDCHRNGDDHMITRGIDTEGEGKSLTCQGCHLGDETGTPELGRLGAPEPKHAGIPTIHFEKLTCTACHSGTWPAQEAGRWETARIHKTGLHGVHNLEIKQPHVYAPVLMKGQDGKIGPYKIFWPSYWATMDRNENISPIPPKQVLELAESILSQNAPKDNDWRLLTQEQITDVLKLLGSEDKQAVYVAGGRLYRIDPSGKLEAVEHDAARPYAWAIAHDVRPASQSFGTGLCKDCHTTDSEFFFGTVERDTPVRTADGLERVEMVKLQGLDRFYIWWFNFTFIFRPALKIVAFAACGIIALVLLAYCIRAVLKISAASGGEGR